MSLGFELAGYDVAVANEIDEWAGDTYEFNHPRTQLIRMSACDVSDWAKVCPPKVDCLVGGPPCQGMSLCGSRDPKDPRNSLFMELVRCAGQVRPRMILVENVVGILSMKTSSGELVARAIIRELMDVGYYVGIAKVKASACGVPQKRERVFFIGTMEPDNELAFSLESLSCGEVTVSDAISDLPVIGSGEGVEFVPYSSSSSSKYQEWAREGSDGVHNHVAMRHTQRLIERFKVIGQGQSVADVTGEHAQVKRGSPKEKSGKAYAQNNLRLKGGEPAPTIPASFQSSFIHPTQHRNLTAREGARLQSFPDRYVFKGDRTAMSWVDKLSQYNQIGNAVPPLMAKAIAGVFRDRLPS